MVAHAMLVTHYQDLTMLFFLNKVLHDVWLLVRVTQAQGLRTDTDPGGYKDLFAFS